MKGRVEKILKKVLLKIKPSKKELESMSKGIEKFVKKLNEKIKKSKVKAEVFVGGSSGKGTVVKRKKQDIDIFVRFVKDKNISEELGKLLKNFRPKKIHGSRDYFKVSFGKLNFEVVPVLKISKPEQAKNVTDLSYFHVSYVKKKIENKLEDDIRLAKAFCFANNVYGAESYIKGFSGYALELLIIYYGSFLSMIKALSKVKAREKKLVIDLEKYYKNKEEIMMEMNEAKLSSPIIFIDPTFKERNVLAGLSYETFFKFQEACEKFLKKPSEKFFFKQKIDKKKYNLILKARTNRQEGDIAGSKLWKFFKFLERELKKYFTIVREDFDYEGGKTGKLYFKIKKKNQIIIEGPPITSVENVVKFKKKHKNCFVKKGKVYAKEKSISIGKFLSNLKEINKKRMKDMGIVNFA